MNFISTVDELKAVTGQIISISDWSVIDQSRIDAFADVSGDRQWIHVDPERAKLSPYGGTIAHGLLTVSIAAHMPAGQTFAKIDIPRRMGLNYGYDRIRFPSPVPCNARVRTVSELLDVREVSDRVIHITRRNTVEIEGSAKPAMVAENIVRMYLDV